MSSQFVQRLDRKFPQSYLIRNPLRGSVLMGLLSFIFLALYHPLNVHPNSVYSFEVTMAIYSASLIPAHWGFVLMLRKIDYFGSARFWTLKKELLAVLFVLTGLGTYIYWMGFWVEGPQGRLNFRTFFDSCRITFLLGLLLYAFLNASNLVAFVSSENGKDKEGDAEQESLIEIKSRLKNENLKFYPSQFIYAVSDGNYVVFYLKKEEEIVKMVIRNSMNEVENELSSIPYFVRTHRAYLVNLQKVLQQKGNKLSYRLKLEGIVEEIPVARNQVSHFEELYEKLT
jgi:hypothetical protein